MAKTSRSEEISWSGCPLASTPAELYDLRLVLLFRPRASCNSKLGWLKQGGEEEKEICFHEGLRLGERATSIWERGKIER